MSQNAYFHRLFLAKKKYLQQLAILDVIRISVANARRGFLARRFSDRDNVNELTRATKHM